MADEYTTIRLKSGTAVEVWAEQLTQASADGFEWVEVLRGAMHGDDVVIMKRPARPDSSAGEIGPDSGRGAG
jgi:hypothetical protein